jgi:NAD(P)-dependent dehydrogenase (short-subunit alcohol dehydrogenase family)
MSSLKGKTLFISGGSRGIGLAIALRAARDGANVTIAAKTTEPNPKLPGTIYSAAHDIETQAPLPEERCRWRATSATRPRCALPWTKRCARSVGSIFWSITLHAIGLTGTRRG